MSIHSSLINSKAVKWWLSSFSLFLFTFSNRHAFYSDAFAIEQIAVTAVLTNILQINSFSNNFILFYWKSCFKIIMALNVYICNMQYALYIKHGESSNTAIHHRCTQWNLNVRHAIEFVTPLKIKSNYMFVKRHRSHFSYWITFLILNDISFMNAKPADQLFHEKKKSFCNNNADFQH